MRTEANTEDIVNDLSSDTPVNNETAEPSDQQIAEEVQAEREQTPEQASEEFAFRFKSPDELYQHKLQYKAAGKEVEEPIETILKRASMGYDYAQRMAEFKRQQEEFQPKLEQAEQLQKYAEWQKYAEENPQWYEHWVNAWENRNSPINQEENQAGPDEFESRIQKLLDERLKPLDDYTKTIEEQKKQYEVEQADKELESSIRSIREKYSDIDFDTTDPETGKSLEYQVLEFQIQNGLNSYEQAFKAYYHDQLVEREVMKAKEQALKEQQKNSRQGIVTGRSTSQFDVAKSNYDQLAEHALRSLQN